MATRDRSRRALIVVAAALVVLAMLADLTRQDSLLRSAWRHLRGKPETPAERLIQGIENTRGVPERPER